MAYPEDITTTRNTPRTDRQIERMLSLLSTSSMTVDEAAAALYISQKSASNYIRFLYRSGRIYVSGWKVKPRIKPYRTYAAGSEPDALPPRSKWSRGDFRTAKWEQKALDALALPQTKQQLSEKLDISYAYASDLITSLKERNEIYIKAWVITAKRGRKSAVYAVGNLPDQEEITTRNTPRSKYHAMLGRAKRDVFASMVAP